MLVLYHGATSVCAAKVRLVLAEKGIGWESRLLDLQRGDQHRADYRALNPNAVVPTLVHDGRVLVESTLIIGYLDEAFPAPALMPADPYQRAIARLWMKKIDDYLHAACAVVTFAIANRRALLGKSPEELEARFNAIPDPAYRERQRLAVTQGVAAPHVPPAVRAFDKYVGEMEDALAHAPWLAGERYSLADAAATPYLNRAELLGMGRLWAGRPRVEAWLGRIRERPNYHAGLEAHLSDGDRARFDVPRAQTWREIEAAMNGRSGAA